MDVTRRSAGLGAFLFALGLTQGAVAQSYPNKNVRLVVPQAAGGVADVVARILADGLAKASGQNFVVENRAGAGTALGSAIVAQAAPDGYALLLGTVSLAILPAIDSKLQFNPSLDLQPVTLVADVPNVLLVHSSVPANTLPELIAYAKKNPGKLSYASQGVGTTGHMAGELLKQVAGIDVNHVPYRGSAPAAQDLIAGHVHILFDALPLAISNSRNSSVKALAIAAPERAKAMPDVPTTAEFGLGDVQTSAWFGLYAPAKTPTSIITWLNEQTQKAFRAPEVYDKLMSQGNLLRLLGPDDFKAYMAKDAERWRRVAEIGKIRVE
jgi:tripartite-type tricarboxylate transporter receptor subunit TctC